MIGGGNRGLSLIIRRSQIHLIGGGKLNARPMVRKRKGAPTPQSGIFFASYSADRGMISAETMAELEARRLLYILGVRERTDKLVRERVLDDAAPFAPLVKTKRGN
jgi:hypothetical protein